MLPAASLMATMLRLTRNTGALLAARVSLVLLTSSDSPGQSRTWAPEPDHAP